MTECPHALQYDDGVIVVCHACNQVLGVGMPDDPAWISDENAEDPSEVGAPFGDDLDQDVDV